MDSYHWSLKLKKGEVTHFIPNNISFKLSIYENKSIIFNKDILISQLI